MFKIIDFLFGGISMNNGHKMNPLSPGSFYEHFMKQPLELKKNEYEWSFNSVL